MKVLFRQRGVRAGGVGRAGGQLIPRALFHFKIKRIYLNTLVSTNLQFLVKPSWIQDIPGRLYCFILNVERCVEIKYL